MPTAGCSLRHTAGLLFGVSAGPERACRILTPKNRSDLIFLRGYPGIVGPKWRAGVHAPRRGPFEVGSTRQGFLWYLFDWE